MTMKKITLSLLLALALVGVGTLWARIEPDITVEPLTEIEDGDNFFICGAFEAGNTGEYVDPYRWVGLKVPNTGDDPLCIKETNDVVGDDFAFTAEIAGEEDLIDGHQGFYLKHTVTGKYVYKASDEGSYYQTMLALTDDKSKAVLVAFAPASERYGSDVPETAMHIITYANDGETVLFLNNNTSDNGVYVPKFGSWSDSCTWFELMPAHEVADNWEILMYQLTDLYEEAQKYGSFGEDGEYHILCGSDPGFYPAELGALYDETLDSCNPDEYMSMGEAADWQGMIDKMSALLVELMKGPNPMTDGIYYIVSAYDQWRFEYRAGYSDGTNNAMWGLFEGKEEEAGYMWQFTQLEDGSYQIQNLLTGGYLNVCNTSEDIRLNSDATKGMKLVDLKLGQWNINASNSLHPKGHSGGAGTSGTLCGYGGGQNSQSAWYLRYVPEELYKPYLDNLEREMAAREAQAELKELIAKVGKKAKTAFEYEVPEGAIDVTPLSYADFTSNGAMLGGAPENERHGYSWGNDGQGYGALIDNDLSTWFHTLWSGGGWAVCWTDYNDDGTPAENAKPTTLHNLGMKLAEPASNVAFQVSPRSVSAYNNPTKINVEASHDGKEWVPIYYGYDFFTPTKDPNEFYIMGPFDLGEEYEYVRFANYMNDRNQNGPFFCFSELKVWVGAKLTETCQAATLNQAVVQALLKAYSDANRYADIVTGDDLDAIKEAQQNLQVAFDAFNGVFVDPADLLAAIEEGNTICKNFFQKEGYLGTYDTDASTEALETAIADAQDLIESGVYNKDMLNSEQAKIEAAIAELDTHMQKPDPTKWYRLQYPSEEEHDLYGWDKGQATQNGEGELSLFDRVAAVMNGDDSTPFEDVEEIREGAQMRCVNLSAIENMPEACEFRFIPVGNDQYIMQNHASGLFLMTDGVTGHLCQMSRTPSVFRIEPIGDACCIVYCADFETREESGITFQFSWHYGNSSALNAFVTWTDTALGSKGSMHVVECGDVEEDVVLYQPLELDEVQGFCNVLNITNVEYGQLYTLVGAYKEEVDDDVFVTWIGFNPISELAAGKPALLYSEEGGNAIITTGIDVASEAAKDNNLAGTFKALTAEVGDAVLYQDDEDVENYNKWRPITEKTPASQTEVAAFTAYLTFDEPFTMFDSLDPEVELWIIVEGTSSGTGIAAVRKALPAADVYDLSGHRLGNTTTLKQLQRGIYIIGGRKVLIP